jgi:hypothetical protein
MCALSGICLRLFAFAAILLASTSTHAQQLIESYVARLNAQDHFNSTGERISSAAAIIRQDRANYHRFNIRDSEDEGDTFFADEDNRRLLEAMLERGANSPAAIGAIVNGTPLVRVSIYRGVNGTSVRVELFNRGASEAPRDSILARTLPRADGEVSCFNRVYDRSHLAQHPDQLVTSMRLMLRSSGEDAPSFSLTVMTRGSSGPLQTGGRCHWPENGLEADKRLICRVECDGGRAILESNGTAESVLLHIPEGLQCPSAATPPNSQL